MLFSPKPQVCAKKAENKAFSRGAERRRKPFDLTEWWIEMDTYDIEVRDATAMDEEIECWRTEKRTRQGYYGDENENDGAAH